nr:glycosyltransferase family 4 protein [uncultured Sphaerochaeta sp.]
METPMHITHVPRRFVQDEWGGTETFITEVSTRLLARGFPTEILTTKALNTTRSEQFRGIPIRRYSYFYPYLGLSREDSLQLDRKAGNLFSWSLMVRLLTEKRPPAILHLHTGKRLGGIVRLCAKIRHIPYVISLHGGYFAVPTSERKTWTDPTKHTIEWGKVLGLLVGSRRVLDDASAILCVGWEEYEVMHKQYPKNQVHYLPNGVDLDRFANGRGKEFRQMYGIAEDAFLLLTVARVDEQKNQLALVTQLPHILQKVPKAHVLMIGPPTNPAYRAKVVKQVEEQGLQEHVTLLDGFSYGDSRLVDAYHSADCFVLPSLHEPFGMVVLEAWASGLAVVASNVGGLKRLVEDGYNGLSMEAEAEVSQANSLASCIIKVAESEELRNKLASNGLQTAKERYSWDHITDELISIYRSVYADTLR